MFVERRAAARLVPGDQPSCRLNDLLGGPYRPVQVRDLSPHGVALVLDRPPPPGTFVVVELTNTFSGYSRLCLMRVLHVAARDEDRYCVGGEFLARLDTEEFARLLA